MSTFAPADFDRVVASLIATFGGTTLSMAFSPNLRHPAAPFRSWSLPVARYQYSDSRPGSLSHSGLDAQATGTDYGRCDPRCQGHGRGCLGRPFPPIDPLAETQSFNGRVRKHTTVLAHPAPSMPARNCSGDRVYVSQDRMVPFVPSFLRVSHG